VDVINVVSRQETIAELFAERGCCSSADEQWSAPCWGCRDLLASWKELTGKKKSDEEPGNFDI